MINYIQMEEKWQKAWADARIFESGISSRNPYFVTAAFPYPNGPQHVGHLRTYGTADALARYKRMKGYNVLYPMGFHATGTPVLAFAKRIKSADKSLIDDLKMFHIPDEDINKMTDPVFITSYFIEEIQKGMKRAGYSIDWRRKFVSTDPVFSRFVEWQFGILNKKGYLTIGKHPVGWCPNENNAVGMHDTRKDVEPEIEKITAVRFRVSGSSASAICATFRPETIHGVTNLFINENAKYSMCRIEGLEGEYLLSKAAAESLSYQLKIEISRELEGMELLQMKCVNPATGTDIPILPGFFVEERRGTGIVMSVPGHAPFDYVALERLREKGYDVGDIKPIKIIEIESGKAKGVSDQKNISQNRDIPAMAYLEALGASRLSSDDVIELATKMEYKEESRWGKMTVIGYEGFGEAEARKAISDKLKSESNAIDIYVLTNKSEVFCRCGYSVVVKVVDNQWFINYGNPEWKKMAKDYLAKMKILPEKIRNALDSAVDWIDLRAVARSQGLGTRFPLDPEKIIESLSDSTIYTAFYTISDIISSLDPKKLSPEFFDFVFLGKGDSDTLSKATGIDFAVLQRARESFEYWYTETSRHSGPDLIFNHLTMHIYNHIVVFDKKNWPKQIVVSGVVLSEGEKMSKSLGNITPLIDALAANGADPLRAVVIAGADLISDSDYSYDAIKGIKERLEYIFDLCKTSENYETGELTPIDFWLYSKLNSKIKVAEEAMEKLELREAFINILYNSVLELKKYDLRGGRNGMVVRDYLSNIALMMQPIIPHVSEELWHMLGNDSFASLEKWRDADKSMINSKIDLQEEMIENLIRDVREIRALISKKSGADGRTVRIIIAEDWKRKLNSIILKERSIPGVMAKAKEDGTIDMAKASKYAAGMIAKIESVPRDNLTQEEEFDTYTQSKEYLERMLGTRISVEKESESGSQRAERALPLKPSIEIA